MWGGGFPSPILDAILDAICYSFEMGIVFTHLSFWDLILLKLLFPY